MFKKLIALILACMMVLSVMTACSSSDDAATSGWVADGKEHWKVFVESGEKTEVGAHELNEVNQCAVCGSEIWDFGDSVSVYAYDTYGNITRMADYDADGNLVSETVDEYEYDTDGNITKDKQYIDGVLSGETEYTVTDGESTISGFTAYYEDGSKSIAEYDANGNSVKLTDYDSDGAVVFQADSEYAEDSNGEWYESQCTETYSDGTKIECTYNERGDALSRVCYDADGNVESSETWEYAYDDDGHKKTEVSYVDSKIWQEITYKTVYGENETFTYPETIAEYDEDGSKTVSVYNENDEVVSETKYDPEGNVVE